MAGDRRLTGVLDLMKRNWIAGALALLSLGTIFLAAPIFWHSLMAQASIETVRSLRAGDDVSEQELRQALQSIGPVRLDAPANGDRLVNQAILSLELALRLPGGSDEQIELLTNARALTEFRLREAPADPHAWARLATASFILDGATPETVAALRMSHQLGPYERYALATRYWLGVTMWNALDDELRVATGVQAVMLWRRYDRAYVVQNYWRLPESGRTVLRTAFEPTPYRDQFFAAIGVTE